MNSNVETGPCILGHHLCRRAWLVKNPTVDCCRECNAHLHQECAKEHGSTGEHGGDSQGFCCPDGHGCNSGKTAAAAGQGTPSSSSAAQQARDDNATPRRTQLLSSSDAQQMQTESLHTTPHRIQLLLAPELTVAEFASIRKRVYDTVILGKGVHVQDAVDEEDLPVVPTTVESAARLHNFEKFKKCGACGYASIRSILLFVSKYHSLTLFLCFFHYCFHHSNNEQADFVFDRKDGDIICTHCGTVAIESNVHEGPQFRKFEGEADRNHHGNVAHPLLSNAYNMGTSNAHACIERNFERTDGRTRTAYKDYQKIDAFIKLKNAGDNLKLHEAVVQRAKEIFAGKSSIAVVVHGMRKKLPCHRSMKQKIPF